MAFALPPYQFGFKFRSIKLVERGAAGTAIFALFFSCRPSAIIRSIRAVIINAVKTVVRRRTFANISKKFFEHSPSITNFYATTTIVLVSWIVGVTAALMNVGPSKIERMFIFLPSVAVLSFMIFTVKTETSTGAGVTISKFGAIGSVQAPTVASALPDGFAVSSTTNQSDHDQSAKSLIYDIYTSGHRAVPIGSRSSGEASVQALTSLRTIALAAERS